MTQAISKARTLYHFTSIEQWPSIHEAQYLNVVESNISLRRAHVGPEVVWLTTTDRVSRNSHGLAGSRYDKSRIRFTVTVRAERWYDFARAHGIHPKTLAVLNETGGGSAGTWWVCRHRIESRDWIEVRDMRSDEVLWTPGSRPLNVRRGMRRGWPRRRD